MGASYLKRGINLLIQPPVRKTINVFINMPSWFSEYMMDVSKMKKEKCRSTPSKLQNKQSRSTANESGSFIKCCE